MIKLVGEMEITHCSTLEILLYNIMSKVASIYITVGNHILYKSIKSLVAMILLATLVAVSQILVQKPFYTKRA